MVTDWRSGARASIAGRKSSGGWGAAVSCWPSKGDRRWPAPQPSPSHTTKTSGPSKGGPVTDLADACSVAAAALHHRQLRPVALEDHTVVFRLLSDRRDDLVAERTRILSRLHVLLAELHPGGAPRELTAARAAALLRRTHPITPVDLERKRIARELLADVRRLDRQVKTASQAIRTAVRDHGTTLTEVYGVGPVLAAKLVGHTGDITRFPDRDHFASY